MGYWVLFWETGAKRTLSHPSSHLWFKWVGNDCMLRHGWRPLFFSFGSYTYILSFMIPFCIGRYLGGMVDSPIFLGGKLEEQQLVC
jgi:hypothetical protein